jgi:hypothetical protein
VYYYATDFVRLVTRERLEECLREADAERLARKFRGTAQRRRRLWLTVNLALAASHRLRPRRLET